MKTLYTIAATENVNDAGHTTYLFELVHTADGRIVDTVKSKSPVPPRKLRDRQARLNTAAYLDGLMSQAEWHEAMK